ncbi:MAG TPA: hypothetical protein VGF82_23955 [Terracidiphilus sp.]
MKTACFVILAGAGVTLYAQAGGFEIPPLPPGPSGPARRKERYPAKPSAAIAFSIPVGRLGFSAPGENYLLRQQGLVSLDFLDEQTILFTFHVSSGLMQRGGRAEESSEQRIRAVVLEIRSGKILAQQEWTVPDRLRYLWLLNDGHFLLRVRDGLDEGDAQLETKAYLRFPGRLMWIQMDPKQEYLIANTVEPSQQSKGQNVPSAPNADHGAANVPTQDAGEQEVLVARTVKRASGDVVRVTQVPWSSQKNDWPMNSHGYLERVHGDGANWTLEFYDYLGKEGNDVARIESTCRPMYSFVSDAELLVSRCDPEEGWVLAGMSNDGKSLWEAKLGSNAMSSQTAAARDGSRVVRETLLLKRSAERYKKMIGAKDLLGQMMKVFDAASGKVLLTAPLTPVFDGGGNVAISPSGQRVAILNQGAIQIFDLPSEAEAQASGR